MCFSSHLQSMLFVVDRSGNIHGSQGIVDGLFGIFFWIVFVCVHVLFHLVLVFTLLYACE